MKRKSIHGCLAIVGVLMPFAAAFAQTFEQAGSARALQAQSLAATCSACHGTAGHAVAGATVPGLAGMPAVYFVEQMRGFKSGARPASVMQQIAKGYSDAQVEQLATYFAAQAPGAAK